MIFIWIPKTGGTTYTKVLHPEIKVITENYHTFNDYDLSEPINVSFGHACPATLLREGIIQTRRWRESKKIAISRHPYYRFLSLYHDYKRTGRITQDFTQRQFISAICEMDPKPGYFNSYQLSMCAPQVSWILPGVEILDFVATFLDKRLKLNAGNYVDMVDKDALDLVRLYYAADFASLNYDY